MRTAKTLAMLLREQLGMTQDTLNAYSSDSVKDFPDRDKYVDTFKERVDVIKVLSEVFANYGKFEKEGLSEDLDIAVLGSL